MIFQEKFNDIFKFIDCMNDFEKFVEENAENFNEAYELFKKEHDLENLYFSKLISIGGEDYMILDVWYEISDIYLTYLEANDRLPEGIVVERSIIKEKYPGNSAMYQNFMIAISSAMTQQVEPEIVCGQKLYKPAAYRGRTEIIKLSNSSNSLPCMIIDRTPMIYDELKNLKSE